MARPADWTAAQIAYREAMALPKGAERDKALRTWQAKYPHYTGCGCSGHNIKLRRKA